MAATTPITFSLQARDWETIIGIISNSSDADIQELMYSLTTYYKGLATKPQGTDVISITTTESTIITISVNLYGNTVFNVTKDVGTNPFNRIMTAIRAANNAADNYISNTLATNDNNYSLNANNIRKNGRRVIMMRQYDNN